MMKYMQRLGKSLMLPVSCLPACGILMGVGYALCPAAMQGGQIHGILNTVGFFLVKAGGALIDNMSWLFAVGVALGMSDDNDGTAGLSGLISWLMITQLLNPAVVTNLLGFAANPSFEKIETQFIGIVSGIIGATCYNNFRGTRLPDALSFFEGKRSVPIITAFFSTFVAVLLFFVWPILFDGLIRLGSAIVELEAVGAGIYAFLNRLLIPFGLHHALNSVFWFDSIGINDLGQFWAGVVTSDHSVGMYMSGFFPCMMFGVPGAALAMFHTAQSVKRKLAGGLLGTAALSAFLCGVTEPFEFAFMFLAPPLYVIYAFLYGIFTTITVALDFRAGFFFSAGLTDLVFSSSLPAAQNTFLIFPLGIAAFLIFYLLFRFTISKFDLKTPGREDETVSPPLAPDDFVQIAQIILQGVGGVQNIAHASHCITRLRLELVDFSLVNEEIIKKANVAGIISMRRTSTIQIILGTKVQFVADALNQLLA